MKLTGFSRPADPVSSDLASHIASAISKTVTDATVTPTEAIVTGSITESDRASIQSALNAYALNPATLQALADAQLTNEQKALRVYSTLKMWAADADAAAQSWSGFSAAQKDAATKLTINRLGIMCDRLADLLRLLAVN